MASNNGSAILTNIADTLVQVMSETMDETTTEPVAAQPVTPVKAVRNYLIMHPNKSCTRLEIADACGLDLKQVTNAMTNIKLQPGFSGHQGVYMYTPTSVSEQADANDGRQTIASLRPSRRAMTLYDILVENAREDNAVKGKLVEIVKRNRRSNLFSIRGRLSPKLIMEAFEELRKLGCVGGGTRQDRLKRLVKHPVELFGGAAPTAPTSGRVESTPASELSVPKSDHEPDNRNDDPVETVGTAALADAIARAMWERYEWALSEIGRLQELVSVQREQIDRMERAISAMPAPDMAQIARRFLADASTES